LTKVKKTQRVRKSSASETQSRPGRKPAPRRPAPGASKSASRSSGVKAREASSASGSRNPPRRELPEVRELAVAAIDAALDKKALMPVLIDVSGMASYTDFIGIVSGRSDRQVDAIADNVSQLMKSRGRRVLGQEGGGSGRWTLLDFGEIVIHVFYHPIREFYDLESLWIDAPRIKLQIPPEAILSQPDALYGAL
jgi:ribosome-associated protein